MIEVSPETAKLALNQAELEQVKILAKQITNLKQLRAILRQADPKMRRGVYELIKPLLVSLSVPVPEYEKLMKAVLKHENKGKKRT